MSKITCPKCQNEIGVDVFAMVPDAQRLTFSIDRSPDSPMMSASTLSGFVAGVDKLLKAVAKQIGAKVHVFVERVEWEPSNVVFHLVIAQVKGGTTKLTSDAVDRILGACSDIANGPK